MITSLLQRVVDEKRIRHDHAYPMEVGPHHCAGCDLEADIKAALARAADRRPLAHKRTDCWCGMPHRAEDFL